MTLSRSAAPDRVFLNVSLSFSSPSSSGLSSSVFPPLYIRTDIKFAVYLKRRVVIDSDAAAEPSFSNLRQLSNRVSTT